MGFKFQAVSTIFEFLPVFITQKIRSYAAGDSSDGLTADPTAGWRRSTTHISANYAYSGYYRGAAL
jgi:hypothetical protein